MKKHLIIVISYISILSTINSLDKEIIFFGGFNVLPFTYDFTNSFGITGLASTTDFSFLLNNIGYSLTVDDYYRSLSSSIASFPQGAENTVFISSYFLYRPIVSLYFKFGNHFVWNKRAFEFDTRGVLSEDRLGFGLNFDLFLTPQQLPKNPLRYFKINFLNKLSFYMYNYNLSFQMGYSGHLRFIVIPYINNINLYIETGLEYLSHNSIAGQFDSVYFSWSIGVQAGNIWKFKEKPIPDSTDDIVQIEIAEEIKTDIPTENTTDKVPVIIKSEFYKSLSNYKVGDIIRIPNIFFTKSNTITGKGVSMLDDIIDYSRKQQAIILLITGYAEDNIKSDELIIQTAASRSTSIRNYMINKGIEGDRIKRSTSALTYDISKGLEPYIEIKILKK